LFLALEERIFRRFFMSTQTVTLSLQPPLCAASLPDYVAAAEELSRILGVYHECDDTLSQDLLLWGTGVLRTIVEHRDDSEDGIATLAQERLGVLSREILINPIDQRPLEDPVIERGWTWEHRMHAEYRNFFLTSPLDDQPMSSEPSSHLFASEMIHWMHRVPTLRARAAVAIPSGNGALRQVGLPGTFSQLAPFLPVVYQQLAQAAVVRRQNRQLREQMEYALVRVDQCMVQMRDRSRQAVEEAVARAREHEAALQERIALINRTHQDTLAGLNGQIASMEERHRAGVAAFEQQMAATDQANIAAVNGLRRQIEAMNQEHQLARVALERQIELRTQENRQEVARLDAQLVQTTQANQAAMATIAATHGRTVAGLQNQIAENVVRLGQTQAHLAAAETRNAQSAAEIQNTRSALAQAQQRISQLQNEVANSDGGGFCSVM
jgi:hypothetical protein